MHNIPYSRQNINEDDIEAVARVLRSDFITQGPSIALFEETVKRFCGATNAVAVTNGTAALHVILQALGIGKGDMVWTSPISFVSSANCALYVGADVDFVDCDPVTANMDVAALEAKLQQSEKNGTLPKALIPVHFSGRACDMQAIAALAKHYGFAVIEDAAHALGGHYDNGEPIGNGAYSDAVIFSFHPVKSIATGEGGMVVSNNAELAQKVSMLRTFCITRDPNLIEGESDGPWYYQQLGLGFNYRMTDIQATLGASQMQRLEGFIARRRSLAARYEKILSALPLTLPPASDKSAWHLYVIGLKSSCKVSRREVFEFLRAANIGCNVHYIPIHTQPFYRKLGFKPGDFPNAEDFYSRAISIPLFPGLTEEEQDYVADKLGEVLG